MKIALSIIVLVALCSLLNRIRGGGFGGNVLPGKALFWVAPFIGATTLFISTWQCALAVGVGYFFWGVFSWGYTMGALADYKPNRPMQPLEKFFANHFSPFWGAFLRMSFVLPCVVLIAWCTGFWYYLLAAPLFAFLAVVAYRYLINPLLDDSWQNAEIATGALWGAVILSPLLFFTAPFYNFF